MRGYSREREKIIEREVAIADRIEAVRGDARKTQLARNGVAVDSKTVAGERARTHGARVRAFRRVLQAREVAGKSFGVREQKMRKQNGLRVLHVRHSGHGHGKI